MHMPKEEAKIPLVGNRPSVGEANRYEDIGSVWILIINIKFLNWNQPALPILPGDKPKSDHI